MSKNNGRFSKLSVLAPAALSACMDASTMAVPAAGAIVCTVLKELSKAFMLKKWFHGDLTAVEAEQLIMQRGKNGSYIVRESRSCPGEYVLTVRVRNRVSHVLIHKKNDKYDIGNGELFDDLVGLIEHYRRYPMTETSGDVLRLLQPVSGTCLRARDIDHKMEEMNELNEPSDVPSVKPSDRPTDKQSDEPKSSESDSSEPDAKCGFYREFLSLRPLESSSFFTTVEGLKKENMRKNRYANVLPFDQTRVILRDGAGSDYINANYVRCPRFGESTASLKSSSDSLHSVQSLKLENETTGAKPLVSKSLSDEALKEVRKYMKMDQLNGNLFENEGKEKVYIATQGCLPNTMKDFWRMIWQEDVRLIAMMTNEYEKEKKKCERYWPSEVLSKKEFGVLTVTLINEKTFDEYIYRELKVTDQERTRTVYHFQFTAWPDHKTPKKTEGILQFIEDVNATLEKVSQEENAPEQNLVCVHCSAGLGRTGTFIVLDTLVDRLKLYGCDIDLEVCDTVRTARAQRAGLVQTPGQFRFIYRVLQQYLHQQGQATEG